MGGRLHVETQAALGSSAAEALSVETDFVAEEIPFDLRRAEHSAGVVQ